LALNINQPIIQSIILVIKQQIITHITSNFIPMVNLLPKLYAITPEFAVCIQFFVQRYRLLCTKLSS